MEIEEETHIQDPVEINLKTIYNHYFINKQ